MKEQIAIEQVREALETILKKILGANSVEIVDFFVSHDSEGEEVFVVELVLAKRPEPGTGNDIIYAARKKLYDLGESRFPLFYSSYSDEAAYAQ